MLRDLMHRLFVKNLYYKLISASLVVVLYTWVLGDRDVVVSVFAPIHVSVPDKMLLTSQPADRAKVTLRGRWSTIQRLSGEALEPIVIETSAKRREETVMLTPDLVRVPPGVQVMQMKPNSLPIVLEDRITKDVTIRPKLVGDPSEGYKLGRLVTTPTTARLEGPRSQVEPLLAVWTEPIDVTGRTASFQKRVSVRYDGTLVRDNLKGDVLVQVPIESVEIERTIEGLPVRVVNASRASSVTPSRLDVVVRGPKPLIESIKRESVLVSLDMSDAEGKGPGLYQRSPLVRNLPPGVALVRIHPTDFQVRLGPAPEQPAPAQPLQK